MEIVNNKKQFRFEIVFPDGEIAHLDYRWLRAAMVLMHTIVPSAQRGKGIANILVKHVLDHARAHNLKVIVYCPFVTKYMEKHPEYQDLVAERK